VKRYLNRKISDYINCIFSGQGLFSARLLKFLDIEFERVQSEEEGVIASVLESPNPVSYRISENEW
jgi:hypothetical protein